MQRHIPLLPPYIENAKTAIEIADRHLAAIEQGKTIKTPDEHRATAIQNYIWALSFYTLKPNGIKKAVKTIWQLYQQTPALLTFDVLLQLASLNIPLIGCLFSLADLAAIIKTPAQLKQINELDAGICLHFSTTQRLFKPQPLTKTFLHDQKEIKSPDKRMLDEHFMTVRDYVDEINFGDNGYYTTGKVAFNRDFATHASSDTRPGLPIAFAYQLFEIWKKLQRPNHFTVVECGAGNGVLCFNILNTIQNTCDQQWQQFYRALQYVIVELSPALRQRQQQKTQPFADKIKIMAGDATKLSALQAEFKQSVCAVISNELPDMFSPHEIRLDENREPEVGLAIPTVSTELLETFFEAKPAEVARLKEKSVALRKFLAASIGQSVTLSDDAVMLSKTDFMCFHGIYTKTKFTARPIEPFIFKQVYVSRDYFPEVTSCLAACPEFTARMPIGGIQYLNIKLFDYMKGAHSLLCAGGEIITVDYGGNSKTVQDQHMRTFSAIDKRQRYRNIFMTPGYRDATYDVDFSMLARAGMTCNLQPVYFGLQSNLLSHHAEEDKALNVTSIAAKKLEHFNKATCFQVLVQTKPFENQTREEIQKMREASQYRFRNPGKLVTYQELAQAEFDESIRLLMSSDTSSDSTTDDSDNRQTQSCRF